MAAAARGMAVAAGWAGRLNRALRAGLALLLLAAPAAAQQRGIQLPGNTAPPAAPAPAAVAQPAPAATQAAAAQPPQQPFLRLELATHTAPVWRLATDAAGRLLATASDDKTIRLWSLPDGAPRGVLRPPIGSGEEGELYAVALAPDGRRLFAAGFTGREWDGAFAIYVFDTETLRLTARLPGLPAPVQHLAISADGSRLAAALGGRGGVRVWDATSGRQLFEDTGYAGPARMVAFDAGNRLASAAADGRVRLYDGNGHKLAERVPLAGARPYGLAFSPDGSLLALGYEDRLRVELLAVADLRTVLLPDVAGLSGEGLPAVAWAHDSQGGVQLHAAGYAHAANRPAAPEGRDFVIRRWADFGLGPPGDIGAARDAIAQLLPLPQGGLAFAAADPGWGRLAPDGSLARAPQSATADFRATGAVLGISDDARRLRFQLRPGSPALVFDSAGGRLEPGAEPAGFSIARTSGGRLVVTDWRNGNRPRLGQQALALGEGEFARSLMLLPQDSGLVLGTDTHLRWFDAAGRLLQAVPLPGAAWGLALAPNGLLAVALGDGTLRWYAVVQGRMQEQAALFVHADARRWVLWTPEGLFDHSPAGGQELVGVHLNNGRAQTPDWASFQQAYRALYAPAEVRARVAGDAAPAATRLAELGDVRARIGQLPQLRASTACVVLAEGTCQAVTLGPSLLVPAGATALRLGLVTQERGLGLGPLDVLVNDRIAARSLPKGGETSVEVALDPGLNRLATRLYADDRSLFAEGPALELRREGEPAPDGNAGRLLVLAVGVDHYAASSLDLRFAVADARTVAETLRAGAANLFREVSVTLLTDAQASRAGILEALASIAARARPEDTFVLYMAGHGLRTETDRRFLFLPADLRDASSWASIRPQALDDETLVAALARIRARDGFLFLDTCHAGQLTRDALSALGNETGRFLLAASTSVQEALDSYDDRNGVFAFAVREGLGGRAAMDEGGRVSALALGEFVTRRVPQLAAEKQHRQDAVFRTAQRDLRSFPLVANALRAAPAGR